MKTLRGQSVIVYWRSLVCAMATHGPCMYKHMLQAAGRTFSSFRKENNRADGRCELTRGPTSRRVHMNVPIAVVSSEHTT
jgi:hypothetical protein